MADKPYQAGNQEEPTPPDWLIDNISELSKNARSIYLIYLGSLAYCSITVIGTTDRQILLNESVRLPIVGVDVSFTGFFVIAPLIAVGTFTYLQLYLHRLKNLKDTLHTEYEPVETGRLYPWMPNVADNPDPGLVGWLQQVIVKIALWWMLPVVLFLFAAWYLKAQDPLIGSAVVLLPSVGMAAVLYFWHRYQGDENSFQEDVRSAPGKQAMLIGGGVLQLSILVIFIATTGGWYPRLGLGVATLDVSSQSLIVEEKKSTPYWVSLKGRQMNGANLRQAILTKADLREARLRGANLRGVHLNDADLRDARLEGANVNLGRLQDAILVRANLSRAELVGTKLQSAHLRDAQLEKAILLKAQLQGANLSGAQLEEANLSTARLDSADLQEARLNGTNLRGAHMKRTNLQMTSLDSTDLRKARIDGALFAAGHPDTTVVATLQGARLDEARLEDLRCRPFGGVRTPTPCSQNLRMISLIVSQLCRATSLEEISTDPPILANIKRRCPHLLRGTSKK